MACHPCVFRRDELFGETVGCSVADGDEPQDVFAFTHAVRLLRRSRRRAVTYSIIGNVPSRIVINGGVGGEPESAGGEHRFYSDSF
jgi:hypothetical protein